VSKEKRKVTRMTQVQTFQLGEWLKNHKDTIADSKWTVSVTHNHAETDLQFPIGRETVKDLGKALGIEFHTTPGNQNTKRAQAFNALSRRVERIETRLGELNSLVGSEMGNIDELGRKGENTFKGLDLLDKAFNTHQSKILTMFQLMADRIAKLEGNKG